MARITDSGMGNDVLKRKLPEGLKENSHRRYFFDPYCGEGDSVLLIRFGETKSGFLSPKLWIGIIFEYDRRNMTADFFELIREFNLFDRSDFRWIKQNREWLSDNGFVDTYATAVRIEGMVYDYLGKYTDFDLKGWKIEVIDVYKINDIVEYKQKEMV